MSQVSGLDFLATPGCLEDALRVTFTSVALSIDIAGTSTWLRGTIGSPNASITGDLDGSASVSWIREKYTPTDSPGGGQMQVSQECCSGNLGFYFGNPITATSALTISCECENLNLANPTNCAGYPVSNTYDLLLTLEITPYGTDGLTITVSTGYFSDPFVSPCAFTIGPPFGSGTSDPILIADIMGAHDLEFTTTAHVVGTDAPYPGDYQADTTTTLTVTFS